MSQTVDWHRVIWDLVQHQMTIREIADHAGIAQATLRGYLDGSHPAHWKGEQIIELWARTTGKPRSDLYLTEVQKMPRHEFVRQSVLKTERVADSLEQLKFAWFGAKASQPTAEPEPAAKPAALRVRFGVARTPWAERPMSGFAVYDDAGERRAEGAAEFVTWCGGWQEVKLESKGETV